MTLLKVQGKIEDWRKAGKISAEVLAYGKTLIKPGASMLEVSDILDKKIIELGGIPAFPVQLSINKIAAHACADDNDPLHFTNELVCLDVGVSVNGCIGDNALTVDLSGKNTKLVEATQEALNSVINNIKAGIKLKNIGKIIEKEITSRGYAPVRNLSGHGLNVNVIHAPPSIPNIDNGDETPLEEGTIAAIEPFASTGAGIIIEARDANIFSLIQTKPTRSPFTKQILDFIKKNYGQLPFTTRWLTKNFGTAKTGIALKELLQTGTIRAYPPLLDKNGGIVAQTEHTLLITKNGCEILTKV